jgi:hypothetical protein
MAPLLLTAEGWRLFKDREGNSYFYDQAGRIHIRDMQLDDYRIVSTRGIDYYIHLGKELLHQRRMQEAVRIMKSIIALPASDGRTRKAQVTAVNIIHELKKRHGQRFERINEQSSLLLYSQGGIVRIIDERMRYSMKIPGGVKVIRKRVRRSRDYRYSGILVGIKRVKEQPEPKETFDLVLALDSEEYAIPIKDLEEAERKWKHNIGDGAFIRGVQEKGKDHVIYHFRNKTPPIYSGLEGLFINGRFSYLVRVITPLASHEKNSALINRILGSFKFVSTVND